MLKSIIKTFKPTLFKSPTRRNIVTIVHQGYEGYRTTWGKDPVRLHPGWHWAIPIIHRVNKVDIRERHTMLTNILAVTKDQVLVKFNVTLFYLVQDVYNACFKVSDYSSSIKQACMTSIKSIVGQYPHQQMVPDQISGLIIDKVGALSASWGIKLIKVELQSMMRLNNNLTPMIRLN